MLLKLNNYKMYRLFILLFLLFTVSNASAQILFKRDPSPPSEPKVQLDIKPQFDEKPQLDTTIPPTTNIPAEIESPQSAETQLNTNTQFNLETPQPPPAILLTQQPIDLEHIQSSQNPKLQAAWRLAKLDTVWNSIQRKIINNNLQNAPNEKQLSQEDAIALIGNSDLEINAHDLKAMGESGYTANQLGKYIDYQKSKNTLKSIIGKPGLIEFVIGSFALATDPIVLILFLSIGLFTKKYRTCLALTLCNSTLLCFIIVKVNSAWHNLSHFNALMWWLMAFFGGTLIALSVLSIKKLLIYLRE